MTVGILYVVYNDINNKIYLGCIWKKNKTIDQRLQEHKDGKGGKHLFIAMQQIGTDHFFIKECRKGDLDYIRRLEVRAIRQLSHIITNKGYNGCKSKAIVMSEEGRKLKSQKMKGVKRQPLTEEQRERIRQRLLGKPRSEQTKEKLRLFRTGKYHTDESIRKMSEKKIGEKNSFFGKKHNDNTKQKISNRDYSQQSGQNHHSKRSTFVPGNGAFKAGLLHPRAVPIIINNKLYGSLQIALQALSPLITVHKLYYFRNRLKTEISFTYVIDDMLFFVERYDSTCSYEIG